MQKVNYPTDHLIVKASVTSEWDNCSFAIIHCPPKWRKNLHRRSRLNKAHARDGSFYAVMYWDYHVEFFQNWHRIRDGEFIDLEEFFTDSHWHFVEISSDEVECLERPKNRIAAHQLKVMQDTFKFQAWGDPSDEKFETEELPIKEITQPKPMNRFWGSQFRWLHNLAGYGPFSFM
jgi:hypothetical protein